MNDSSKNKPLSRREEKLLAEFESIVAKHQKDFYPVGLALIAIQEQKLYRTQCDTFEGYLNEVCNLCERQAYRLINAAVVMENLTHGSDVDNLTHGSGFDASVLPANERQARPLTPLTPEEQIAVWNLVLETIEETDTRITGALVSACVREYKGEQLREEIKKAENELEDLKQSANGRKISPQMDQSFRGMLTTIQAELDSKWRETSKDMVIDWLQNLLAAVEGS